MNIQVVDKPTTLIRNSKWTVVYNTLKQLEGNKAIRLSIPENTDKEKFRNNLRQGLYALCKQHRDEFKISLGFDDNGGLLISKK